MIAGGSPNMSPLADDRKSRGSASFDFDRPTGGTVLVGTGPSLTCRSRVAIIFLF